MESRISDTADVAADALVFMGGPTPRDRIEVGSDLFYVRRRFFYRGVDLEVSGRWRPMPQLALQASLSNTTDMEDQPGTERVLKSTGAPATQPARAGQMFILSNTGVQMQAIWSPFPRRLTITSGLRVDLHTIYGPQLSTRVAAVYQATNELTLKAFYGSAFKAPSALLLYGAPLAAGDVIGNPQLKASHVHTAEIQVSYQLERRLTWSAGVVTNTILNKAEFTPQGFNTVARNISSVLTLGVESQLDLIIQDWLRAYANVAFNRTQRLLAAQGYIAQLVGTENTLYPALIANTGATFTLPRTPLRAGVEVSAVSERRASDANILDRGQDYFLSPYLLVGGHVGLAELNILANRPTTVSLIVRNLLNHKVADPGLSHVDYPPVPRTLMVQVHQQL